jgi:tetratricopeptide (TPR) repeat protein
MKRAYDLGFVAEAAFILGGLEEKRGNYEKAERYYLKAAWPSAEVRRMTRNRAPEVYAALGNLHWKWAKSDPKRAAHHRERVVHFFGRAYEFSSKDPWILYNLGKFYLEQGNLPEAQECFRTVHEKVPDTYYGEAAGKLMLVESPSNKERPGF